MSLSRSPRLAEARRKEDEADARKVAAIVGAACFLAAAALVLGITIKVLP